MSAVAPGPYAPPVPADFEQLCEQVAQGLYEPRWAYPRQPAPMVRTTDDPDYAGHRQEVARWNGDARRLHREVLCEHTRLVLAPGLYPAKWVQLYAYAWEQGHSSGLATVLGYCAELCDLVQALGLRVRP